MDSAVDRALTWDDPLPEGLLDGVAVGDDAVDGATIDGAPDAVAPKRHRLLEHPWWGVVCWVVGLALGVGALSDNSFLTHLATGRVILDDGAPMYDVFSTASGGRPVVVQSWLASWWYASLEDWFGPAGIRAFVALVTATLMVTLWRVTRPAGALVARVGLVAMAGMTGLLWWNERPQLIAFALLALVAVVVTERAWVWWSTPLFLVWVNVHGSFPLGVLFVGMVVAGRVVSQRKVGRRDVAELAAVALGVVAGASVSPYGFQMLTFPVELLGRSQSLSLISEWRPLSFATFDNVVFVLEAVVLLALLAWRRNWVRLASAAVFVALAFMAVRNVAIAALALIPLVAPAFAGLGTPDDVRPLPRLRAVTVGGVALVLATLLVAATPDYDLSAYPTRAVGWMEEQGWVGNPGRDLPVLSHDYDGNYLEWRYGPGSFVWIDDRAELHDYEVVRDYVALLSDLGDTDEVLARRIDPDTVVLWQARTPLARHLEASDDWRIAYEDGSAIVACQVRSPSCPR